MNIRPTPRFSFAKACHEAPPESFAYTVFLLSPDSSKPDALAVIDVNPELPELQPGRSHRAMPNKGDEFTISAGLLLVVTITADGHAFLERRYLIIPACVVRIYIVGYQKPAAPQDHRA